MYRGYIKLWRKIEGNALWTKKRKFSEFEAWIDILMEARHQEEPGTVMIGNRILEVRQGEVLYSMNTWADRWKWSRSKVLRYLDTLSRLSQICTKSEQVTIRITVKNYSTYNGDANRMRTAREQDVNTTKECKNVRMKKNKILSASEDAVCTQEEPFYLTKKKRHLAGKRLEAFNRFWTAFAYQRGKAEAADAWLDVPEFTSGTLDKIVEAALMEAERRPSIIAQGRTPKMAQGWISGRRWEDDQKSDNDLQWDSLMQPEASEVK